ncbi:hypothetical protein LINPERPRIM_LOCUS34089 [Linum perenne]
MIMRTTVMRLPCTTLLSFSDVIERCILSMFIKRVIMLLTL